MTKIFHLERKFSIWIQLMKKDWLLRNPTTEKKQDSKKIKQKNKATGRNL